MNLVNTTHLKGFCSVMLLQPAVKVCSCVRVFSWLVSLLSQDFFIFPGFCLVNRFLFHSLLFLILLLLPFQSFFLLLKLLLLLLLLLVILFSNLPLLEAIWFVAFFSILCWFTNNSYFHCSYNNHVYYCFHWSLLIC